MYLPTWLLLIISDIISFYLSISNKLVVNNKIKLKLSRKSQDARSAMRSVRRPPHSYVQRSKYAPKMMDKINKAISTRAVPLARGGGGPRAGRDARGGNGYFLYLVNEGTGAG